MFGLGNSKLVSRSPAVQIRSNNKEVVETTSAVQQEIKVMNVTPEMAVTWLEKTPRDKQRPLKLARVKLYSEMMKSGAFKGKESNDLIQISESHEVVNGQHRLAAIVESNTTQPMKVEFNVPWSAFLIADRGAKKSLGDDLSQAGLNGKYAPVINAINTILQGMKTNANTSTPEAKILYAKYEEDLDWIQSIYNKNKNENGSLLQSYNRAALVLAHHVNKTKTEEFVQKYLTGANCAEDDAPLVLRNTMLFGGRRGHQRDEAWAIGFKTLQSIHFYINNEKIKRLRPVETQRSMFNLVSQFTTPKFTWDD